MPTKYLSPIEVPKFRDYAWKIYFSNPAYLKAIENTFGQEVVNHIFKMLKTEIRRDYNYVRKIPESCCS